MHRSLFLVVRPGVPLVASLYLKSTFASIIFQLYGSLRSSQSESVVQNMRDGQLEKYFCSDVVIAELGC